MQNRTVFGKLKVEEVETWLEQNKGQMSSEEVRYVENVIYRKKYNSTRWKKIQKVQAKMAERFAK